MSPKPSKSHSYIYAWDLDGSLLTYFYTDHEEVDSAQVGVGYQSTLNIPKEITSATHKVRALQYAYNNTKSEILFYREQSFEMK